MNKNNKKILVVEDELPMRDVLCEKFIREGFAVLNAKNGKEGLAIALSEHPDLILLDIVMPIMDGMSMLKKLRQDVWGKNARVITLTNLSDDSMVAEALAQGSYDYLVKSNWKIKDIAAIVKRIIGK